MELSAIHDFSSKLCQPEILTRVKEYVEWQAFARGTLQPASGRMPPPIPEYAPVSINLDLTTACNYACDHCVDAEILNTGIGYAHDRLLDSLEVMARKGLRSVIVIGGGEPTVYPRFTETIRQMKHLGLQVSIVSNGSRMGKIAEIADCLREDDWVRLSLDAGSDELFQVMHRPKKPITLDEICSGVSGIRAMKPGFKLGFSFIIAWKGATIHDSTIVENTHEIVLAAKRARRFEFDYIAYKPFLTRAKANHAEIVDLASIDNYDRIRRYVDEARQLETADFKVYATTNLKVMLNNDAQQYTDQPHNCHMQFFRQVLSPLGIFNCPVYRNQPHAKIADKNDYSTDDGFRHTIETTAHQIRTFDASEQCKDVICLYNNVNWWLEDLICHPSKLASLTPTVSEVPDFFL